MTGFPNVANRLRFLPRKKQFIFIVRDSIEHIESHMDHNIAANTKKIDVLFAEDNLAHFVAVSRYAFQLDAYSRAFPAQQILLLDF